MQETITLFRALQSQSALLEALILCACLLTALGLTQLLFKAVATALTPSVEPSGQDQALVTSELSDQFSVWFGPRVIGGLMFPLLALVLTFAAKEVWILTRAEAVFKIAVPVLLALVIIRFMARVLSSVFPNSSGVKVLETGVTYLVWGVAALWITGFLPWVNQELESVHINFGRTKLDLRVLIEGVLSSCVVLVITLWISATLERQVLARAVLDLSLRKVVTNVLRVFLTFIGLLVALSAVGVDLTALSVLGGGLGVGLGLGLQKLAANYVSGFVILLERSIRIGDQVRLSGAEGRVTDIKTRYTLIRDAAGREIVIPNEMMISDKVENLSRVFGRVLLQTTVILDYSNDFLSVQSALVSACLQAKQVLDDPPPQVHLLSLGTDGMEILVVFWVDASVLAWVSVKTEVNRLILRAMQEQGIAFASNQRHFHLVSGGLNGVIG